MASSSLSRSGEIKREGGKQAGDWYCDSCFLLNFKEAQVCVGCADGEQNENNVVRTTKRKGQAKALANQTKAIREMKERQEQIREAKGCTCGWVYCDGTFCQTGFDFSKDLFAVEAAFRFLVVDSLIDMVDNTEYVIKDVTLHSLTLDIIVYDENWLEILIIGLRSLGLLSEHIEIEKGPVLNKSVKKKKKIEKKKELKMNTIKAKQETAKVVEEENFKGKCKPVAPGASVKKSDLPTLRRPVGWAVDSNEEDSWEDEDYGEGEEGDLGGYEIHVDFQEDIPASAFSEDLDLEMAIALSLEQQHNLPQRASTEPKTGTHESVSPTTQPWPSLQAAIPKQQEVWPTLGLSASSNQNQTPIQQNTPSAWPKSQSSSPWVAKPSPWGSLPAAVKISSPPAPKNVAQSVVTPQQQQQRV